MSGSHLSKDFFDLVKSIGESRSKSEEDRIISNEVSVLKARMAAADVSAKKMRELLIRMIYVEMLGHDASFGHICAVKAVTNKSLMEKRVGYLAVSLTLHSDHSFMLLLINSIQSDLRSDNYLVVCMALTVVCKLVSSETVPALLPLVAHLFEHKEPQVKKKALMALHRFHQLDPSSVQALIPQVRKSICDANISVMSAALHLLHELAVARPTQFKDLIPDFVSILKQIVDHRLPRDYDYHRIPAPWIQMQILKLLGVLGANDKAASEAMYEILRDVMKRADVGINVGYAIVYECTRTITAIYPDSVMLEEAALAISRFIGSENHNLKYLGVNALASIVQIDSKYAADHQMTVIDCLTDTDETLKRKTLDLLYSMTNPANVAVIVDKLLYFLKLATDPFLKSDLVGRISQLAEKFAPSPAWYIQTMTTVFELAADYVREDMAENLKKLIAESAVAAPDNANGNVDSDIRTYAVETFLKLIQSKKVIPPLLLQVMVWVLGEYGQLAHSANLSQLLESLTTMASDRTLVDKVATKSSLLSAIIKLSARWLLATSSGSLPASVLDLGKRYQSSLNVDIQQRAHELLELNKSPNTLKASFPIAPAHSHQLPGADLIVDSKLTFLDAYVRQAVANGAKPYRARDVLEEKSDSKAEPSSKSGLKFQPYAAPAAPFMSNQALPTIAVLPSGMPNAALSPIVPAPGDGLSPPLPVSGSSSDLESGLKLSGVTRKWGPTGYAEAQAQKATNGSAPPQSPLSNYSPASQMPLGPAAVLAAAAPSASLPVSGSAANSAANSFANAGSAITPKPRRDERLDAARKEKEKLAGALFAGVGNTPATNAASFATARPIVSTSLQRAPISAPAATTAAGSSGSGSGSAAPVVDLLGAFLDTNHTTSPPPAAAVAHQSIDLLFHGTAPVTSAPATDFLSAVGGGAAPVTAGGVADPLHSLFDGLGPASPIRVSSPPASTAPPTASSSSSRGAVAMPADPFAALLSSSSLEASRLSSFGAPGATPLSSLSSMASSSSSSSSSSFDGLLGGEVFGISSLGASFSMPFAMLPRSAESVSVNDARAQVSWLKAVDSDSTVLVIAVANKSAAALSNVVLQLSIPSGFTGSLTGDRVSDGGLVRSASAISHAVSWPSIPPKRTVGAVLALQVKDLAFASLSSLFVQSSLQFMGQSSALVSSHTLDYSDVLRAVVGTNVNTQSYGALWKAHSEEVKCVVKAPQSSASSNAFVEKISSLRFANVQTIGNENILLAKLAGSSSPTQGPTLNALSAIFVLIHAKVQPASSQIDFIIRTRSAQLSNQMSKWIQTQMK